MATNVNKPDVFRRCNLPEELIKRFTSSKGLSTSGAQPSKLSLKHKRNSAPAFRVTEDASVPHSAKNKVNLERLLLSIPLDNDVANFSDTEGPVHNRLPLYSENYESESFCLPSAGYKSDSEGRGRSKYKIRTSHSANPSPDHSPERPATRASVRRTRSLNAPNGSARIQEIRQNLRESKRQEVLNKNNIHERLKQLGTRGLNTTNTAASKTSCEKTVYSTRNNSLRSRSLNQIAVTEKAEQTNHLSQEINNNINNNNIKTSGNRTSVIRSRSFNSLVRNSETRNTLQNSQQRKTTNSSCSTSLSTNDNTTINKTTTAFQPSATSAFEKVRQQFGNDKWKRRLVAPPTTTTNNTTLATPQQHQHTDSKNENLRSSSFSSLQDAWESRKTFEKSKKLFHHHNNTTDTNTFHHHHLTSPHIHQNSISDVESSDIISRRRERRRVKREIYNLRLQSDKSDSETETEDTHFERHALERLERRRANSNPRRSSSRSSRLSERSDDGNNSDSNDENNNECPSDKTLDSGVFDLALSNLSANICKLSNRYNSNEFLADCLSPKSGYSSATESLAESLAESTTTFYDSNDDNMESRRNNSTKRGVIGSRPKHKTDNTNAARTAVLNSTRAKGNLGMNGTAKPQQVVNQTIKKETPTMSGTVTENKSGAAQTRTDTKQTIDQQPKLDQIKPQVEEKVNKRQQKSPSKSTTSIATADQQSSLTSTNKTTAKGSQNKTTTTPEKDKQIVVDTTRKSSSSSTNNNINSNKKTVATTKSNEGGGGEKNKENKPEESIKKESTTPKTASKNKVKKTVSSNSANSVESVTSTATVADKSPTKDKLKKAVSKTPLEAPAVAEKSSEKSPTKNKPKKAVSNTTVEAPAVVEKSTEKTPTKNKLKKAVSNTESIKVVDEKSPAKDKLKKTTANPTITVIEDNTDVVVEQSLADTSSTTTKDKKQPPLPAPKKKNGIVETIPTKSIEPAAEQTAVTPKEKEETTSEKTKTSPPVKAPKNGLLSKERKISHHNCCTPTNRSESPSLKPNKPTQERKTSHHSCCVPNSDILRSESPSLQQKKTTRRISHQGCHSPVENNSGSRSNTPTKTRRVSHVGCFPTTEKSTSDSETTFRNRRVSHHNCFKPVNTSESDNSRSNTPTLSHSSSGDVTPTPTTSDNNNKTRRISHHNCVESPEGVVEEPIKKRRHSLQASPNSMERNNYTNVNYRIHLQSNSPNKAAIIMGPAQIKDEIKPKLARECISPTLINSITNHQHNIIAESNNTISDTSQQLFRIDEHHHTINNNHNNVSHTDKKEADKTNGINVNQNAILNCHHRDNNNGIAAAVVKQESSDEHLSRSDCKQTDEDNMALHKKKQSLKFTIDADKSKVESRSGSNKSHRLLRQGESIEVHLSLDNKNIENSTSPSSPTTTAQKDILSSGSVKALPTVAPKPLKSKQQSSIESLHKGVQCLLLTGESSSNKCINVCDISREITLNEDIITELGGDVLEGISFTYPEYLLTVEQKNKIERDLKETEAIESELEKDELDVVDSSTTPTQGRFEKEKEKSFKLKMENTRLQQLLYEVEKARAGTMKALLHVNTALNKVQGENTQLESDVQVTGQENSNLKENIKEYQDKEKQSIENTGGKKGDRTLSIFVDQWKKEKKELLGQLNTLKSKKEVSEKSTTRLQVQYKKVKEQLEHSNNAFTTTLKNNLEATKKLEEELKGSFEERQEMLKRVNDGNKYKRELETLRTEMEELQAQNEELQDENDSLEQKCKHLEKQKKQLLYEEEELHEQISHSQEIIEKLTDVEDELKERLHAEMKDKEYLQECLDETGHILFQLKNNEHELKEDRDILITDLEQEQVEKQSLQTTLNMTMDEHKEIVDRLQDMTNIHINVKESLQQANNKEKNYQGQIEALTKTNHILHYTLEKEKEERMDMQEMFDIIESDHKKFKNESVGTRNDMENKIDNLSLENHELKQKSDALEKKCDEIQNSLEHKEDENTSLHQKVSRLEQLQEAASKELESLQDNSEEIQKSRADLLKLCQELEVDLKISKQANEKVTCSLEETEESFERATKELTETKRRLEEYRNDYDDLQSKNRERMKKMRDLESANEDLTEQKERFQNRMTYYEGETRELRKKVNEQTEEIGTLQIESQRFQRERDTHKRNCDMSVNDFETHKAKCTETLRRLKDEIIELSSKIVEKERFAMKQKEQFQDQIENSQNDLKLLRSMLDGEIKRTVTGGHRLDEQSDSGSEKLDLGILKNSHDKFRNEFQSHVNKLEDMLKNSNEVTDSVTVVQSPMSKIKLEELKQLRNEMFELQDDLAIVKTKYASLSADVTSIKLGMPAISSSSRKHFSCDKQLEELEDELTKLDELISRIESRHKAVMTRNSVLLQRTLKEDDVRAKDLVKTFQMVALEGENKQLKTLLGILKKKYNFDECEIADELNKVNQSEETNGSLTNGSHSNGTHNNNNVDEFASDDEPSITSKRISARASSSRVDRTPVRSQSTRRAQRNYSFFNEAVGATEIPTSARTSTYNRENLHQRSSGVSSYSSEDDDYTPTPRLPKRYNTLPPRARRTKP